MKHFIHTALIGVTSAVQSPASQPIEISFVLPELQIPSPPVNFRPVSPKLLQPLPFEIAKSGLKIESVCGGVWVLEYQAPGPLGLIDLFGSVEDFHRVLSSDSLEIVELKPRADFTPTPEYADRRIKLPFEDAIALRSVMGSDSSFDWRSAHQTESRADFRVKFATDGHVISLDLFLSARCVRLVSGKSVGMLTSMIFGFSTVAEVIERHFPGSIPKD